MAGRVTYYGGIVVEGLVLNLDSAKRRSLPNPQSTVWKDVSGKRNNATILNGAELKGGRIEVSTEGSGYTYLESQDSSSFSYLSRKESLFTSILVNNGTVAGIRAETDPCSGLVTFEQALDYAYQRGGRLPTRNELLSGSTRGTGCGYDYELIWSCTKGDEAGDFHWVAAGDPGRAGGSNYAGDPEIRSNTGSAYVRMVADVDKERTDPVTLQDPFIYNYLSSSYGFSEGELEVLYKGNVPSFEFDGVDDYISLGKSFIDTGEIGTGDVPYTLEAWILLYKFPDEDESGMCIIGNDDANGIGIQVSSNRINFGYRSTDNFDNNTDLQLNQWYHVVGTREPGANNRIYVNGQLDGTSSISLLTVLDTSYNMHIGYAARRIITPFQGRIAAPKIYNTYLTDEQVLRNYNALKGRFGL